MHGSVSLADGRVLVSGGWKDAGAGYDPASWHKTCSLFDPATKTWTPTGSFATEQFGHAGHTTTLLQNGKVLAVGGFRQQRYSYIDYSQECELYNPATGQWTLTGYLPYRRCEHTATLLPDGKVLVAGGRIQWGDFSTHITDTCLLYDPVIGAWGSTGRMVRAREGHAAVLLPNGEVLVAGGSGGSPFGFPSLLDSYEIYSPASGTWRTGWMPHPRQMHTLTLLQDGTVLVAGGEVAGWVRIVRRPRRGAMREGC